MKLQPAPPTPMIFVVRGRCGVSDTGDFDGVKTDPDHADGPRPVLTAPAQRPFNNFRLSIVSSRFIDLAD
jgi:hypothetical protein